MRRLRAESDGRELVFAFPVREVVLGSSPNADLVLPMRGVSRRHARLTPAPEGLWISDLGSKHGLMRDGRRFGELLLTVGERVRLGDASLLVEELETSAGDLALALPAPEEPESARCRPEPTRSDLELASPAAALRLVRACERLELSRDELGETVRTQLGAKSLLVMIETGNDSTLTELWGEAPAPDTLTRLARLAAAGATAGSLEGSIVALSARRARRVALALLAQPALGWQRDLFDYAAAKLLDGPPNEQPRRTSEPGGFKVPAEFVVGTSPASLRLLAELKAIAPSSKDVLLQGETGSGKELVARILHQNGPRARGPFVAVNCAALPENLLESELFGIEAHVATDVEARPGLFRAAEGGTLFLDEVGEMPLGLQAKLLRVLENRAVRPVGARQELAVSLRVISASNRHLDDAVGAGSMRADLYYRLRSLIVRLPSLRERREDLGVLVLALVRRSAIEAGKVITGVSRGALARLEAHSWPGNVRELKAAIDRAVLFCPHGAALAPAHFAELETVGSSPIQSPVRSPESSDEPPVATKTGKLSEALEEVERRTLLAALAETGGNQSAAAQQLGISRNGLALKLRRLGLAK